MKTTEKSKKLSKEEKFRKIKKNVKGITLIALVVTIIVLLILAGVAINLSIGQNGILSRAKETTNISKRAEVKEKVQMEVLASYDNEGTFNIDRFKDNLKENLRIEENKIIENADSSISVTIEGFNVTVYRNGIVIIEGEILNGKTDGSYDLIKGCNTPKINSGMKLVSYDEASQNWIEDSTNFAYSYEVQTSLTDTYDITTGEYGTSKWANAELNGNYYVWIPRYAYKIDKNTQYTTEDGRISYKIDIKFLVGTSNKFYNDNGKLEDAKVATNADEILSTNNTFYYVHPAFKFGDRQLEGIWVGKYETSGDENEPIIQPNKVSMRNVDVSTMFRTAQKLSTEEIDAHMLKNTEWGAVAYLTQSNYGRNGTEVSVNQCSDYITGAGKTQGSNLIYENSTYSSDINTIKGTDQAYNGKIGKLSSTTGNVYGIYDMAGGAWEYVMGVNGNDTPILGSSGFLEFPSSQYYNMYEGLNNTNIGDALYETSSWNSGSLNFVNLYFPFFRRGGSCNTWNNSSLFYFNHDAGNSTDYSSFRVCLAVK